MEYNIAAKPTIYKGFRFRSRLEARWAVFFDQIGVKWEYEPGTYLVEREGAKFEIAPDFKVEGLFVEIKPRGIRVKDATDLMCRLQALDYFGVMIIGDPLDIVRGEGVSEGNFNTAGGGGHEYRLVFTRGEYEHSVVVPSIWCDFQGKESYVRLAAEYARQYDFMQFLPN